MSKKTKKLKKKLRVAEARLYRLENHLAEIEQHTYDAVGSDIDRLHDQVDMWADTKLKDRVAALEEMALAFALDELRNATPQEIDSDPFGYDWPDAMEVLDSAFEQLLYGMPEAEQYEIRKMQRTSTSACPAWVLAKNDEGKFSLSKYFIPEGATTAVGEAVFELDNVHQLMDMLGYINDTLDVTGWWKEDSDE